MPASVSGFGSSASYTMAAPGGAAAGDLALAFGSNTSSNTGGTPPASPWVTLTGHGVGWKMYSRVAQSVLATPTDTVTFDSNRVSEVAMLTIRGYDSGGTSQYNSADVSASKQTPALTGFTSPCIVISAIAMNSTPISAIPSGYSLAGNYPYFKVAYKLVTGTSEAPGPWRFVSSDALVGFTIAIPVTSFVPNPVTVSPALRSIALSRAIPRTSLGAIARPVLRTVTTSRATPRTGMSTLSRPVRKSVVLSRSTPKTGVSALLRPIRKSIAVTRNTPRTSFGVTTRPIYKSITIARLIPRTLHGAGSAPGAKGIAVTRLTPRSGVTVRSSPLQRYVHITSRGTPSSIVDHIMRPPRRTVTIARTRPATAITHVLRPNAKTIVVTKRTPHSGASQRITPTIKAITVTRYTPSTAFVTGLHPMMKTVSVRRFATTTLASGPDINSQVVTDALTGAQGTVVLDWRFEKRDRGNSTIADITDAVVSFALQFDGLKTTAVIDLVPSLCDPINFLADNIAAICDITLHEQGSAPHIVSVQCGLFVLTAPTIDRSVLETWSIKCTDFTTYLSEARTTAPYVIPAGANVLAAAESLIFDLHLRNSLGTTTITVPDQIVKDPGTSREDIINMLLGSVNYIPVAMTNDGTLISYPIVADSVKPPIVTYTDGEWILGDISETQDMSSFFNEVYMSAGSITADNAFVTVKQNNDLDSPVSIPNIGRTITQSFSNVVAADQASLDAMAVQALAKAAQGVREADIVTQVDPRRWFLEVYHLQDAIAGYDENWITEKFSYSMDDPSMTHTVRRVEKVVIL